MSITIRFTRLDSNKSKGLAARFYLLPLLLVLVAAMPAAAQSTITVGPNGQYQNLQSAIDVAQPGDTLSLEAGATFVGNYVLRLKPGGSAAYITLQSSAVTTLPAGIRVKPSQASLMPKIASPGFGASAISTEPGAHHYRFIGIEITTADSTAFVFDLIALGDGSAAQNTLASVPHHLTFDRCYIHAQPAQGLKRGIALNSADTEILNSYIAEFKNIGQEAQALGGWNGPGPFKINNNYIEGAGENLIFGGAQASIQNLVPSDIEIRGNHFFKPLKWKVGDPSFEQIPGQDYSQCTATQTGNCPHWAVKNLFELKNARRVVVDGNVLENNWADAQNGFGVLFTVRGEGGTMPWATIEDVQFTNNILRNSDQGINVLGKEPDTQQSRRLTIRNNLFDNVRGNVLQIYSTDALTIDHNTATQQVFNTVSTAGDDPSTNFAFTNNLTPRGNYGFFGTGFGEGIPALNRYFPGYIFRRNVIHGVPDFAPNCGRPDQIGCYPADNFRSPMSGETFDSLFLDFAGGNYRLAAASTFRNAGTDATDVGVRFDLPLSWTSSDIGGVGIPGATSQLAGEYAVSGSGISNQQGTADNFQFAYRQDSRITARITRYQPGSKAGVMLRMGLNANAPMVALSYTPTGVVFERRTSTNGPTATLGTLAGDYKWLRVVRTLTKQRTFRPPATGTTESFAAYASIDGLTYTLVGSTRATSPVTDGTPYVGLAVTSKDNAMLRTAVFDNISF